MTHLSRDRRGFTLVELLVVVGIIAVLIGILLPTLGRARAAAKQTRSLSNLRQLMLGYTAYYQDHKGQLLPGHPPTGMLGTSLYNPLLRTEYAPATPIEAFQLGQPIRRYPWRIVGYVSNVFEILHSHTTLPPLPQPGDTTAQAIGKAYALSVEATYGLNTVFVGGDSDYGGFVLSGGVYRQNVGRHCVFKASEIRRPTQLIVFSDSRARNTGTFDGAGLHRVIPPRANGPRWHVEKETFVPDTDISLGVPQGYYTGRAAVAFFDGHVESMRPSELEDMRLWCARAHRSDYDFVP